MSCQWTNSLMTYDPMFLELGVAVKLVYHEQNDKNGLIIHMLKGTFCCQLS